MQQQMTFSLRMEVDEVFSGMAEQWEAGRRTSSIWAKDAAVWSGGEEARWLGWLDIAERELKTVGRYDSFAEDCAGFGNIVLLGMGGSSLCPEVLSLVFGNERFRVLDSTVPAQIADLDSEISIADTLFIVASKSGSTLEPNSFMEYFHAKAVEALGAKEAGRRFVAITDPGSKLEAAAKEMGFRHVFYGDPEVGGRFSALSVFGLVPAAAMGLDVGRLLRSAIKVASACRIENVSENPGVLTGLILGACVTTERDKLEIIASETMRPLGAWMEQLIAESTGKEGKAIIPIDRNGSTKGLAEGPDRVYAFVLFDGDNDEELEALSRSLSEKGNPVITIRVADRYDIAGEFFRWEFATAVAGATMGIDPFNQPDVEAAKIAARKITDEFERTGSLPPEKPFFSEGGISLFTDEKNEADLRARLKGDESVGSFIDAHLSRIRGGDYFSILAYLNMNDANVRFLEEVRNGIGRRSGAASALQFGPRFLHSTGQAHKGGPNSGVFLQLTTEDDRDLEVPGHSYTFGVIKSAQARGDFEVLLERGRRALRVHFEDGSTENLEKTLGGLA